MTIAFAPVALNAQQMIQNDADAKEVASYRLTMEAFNRMKVAWHAAAEEAKKDPKYQELARLETELETLRKKEEPSEAEQARIEELSTKQQQLKNETEGPGLFNDVERGTREGGYAAAGVREIHSRLGRSRVRGGHAESGHVEGDPEGRKPGQREIHPRA
jgi:hypothetical protein